VSGAIIAAGPLRNAVSAAPGPEDFHSVAEKLIICGHDGKLLELRLCDEHAVERITMMGRQGSDVTSVRMKNRKGRDRLTLDDGEEGFAACCDAELAQR
jgi:hypothetical protein